jgi:hypothetical protein
VTYASAGTASISRARPEMSRDLTRHVALLVADVWGPLRDLTADTSIRCTSPTRCSENYKTRACFLVILLDDGVRSDHSR